jgi:parallel beta-helix repeat protein
VATATDYYLDAVNGNDSNLGTSAEPWETLGRAYTSFSGPGTKVQEGDTVYFKNGSYGDFIESTQNGAAYLYYRSSWITYAAAPGHSPELNNINIINEDRWAGAGDGSSYLVFDGFRVSDGIILKHTSYVQILDCNITREPESYAGEYAPYFNSGMTAIYGETDHYITITGNQVSSAYRGIGIKDSSDNLTITDNTIHRIGEDGMSLPSSYMLIEGNRIYDIHKYHSVFGIEGPNTGEFTSGEQVIQAGTNAEGIVYRYRSGELEVWQTSVADFNEPADGGGV